MKYQTHAYLASCLHPVLCETWGIPFSLRKFIEGSVKPDMSSLFIRHPHFWKHSKKYLFRKIEAIVRTKLKPGRKQKKFSEKLGVILHYAADFFTAAHNLKPNRILEHMAYEDILHEELLRVMNAESLGKGLPPIMAMLHAGDHGLPDIEELIRKQHREYHPSVDDPAGDARQITLACLTIAAYIMERVAPEEMRVKAPSPAI